MCVANIQLSEGYDQIAKDHYIAFNIDGKEAREMWKYLDDLQGKGFQIEGEAEMNKSYRHLKQNQSNKFYCFKTNPIDTKEK